ncbi:hypothetical protein A2U01_0001047 [Trifolium medium]|uniref:Uncharacterized protein n=1 Tax=Trifolium medium TaxID=97028 RepID=A0A392LZ55_9FABA|nr:hypothetical protein [Trifolium medium]
MRIMTAQNQGQQGGSMVNDSSEDEEEEDDRRMMAVVDEPERESEGEGENLLALNSNVNAHNIPINANKAVNPFLEVHNTHEVREEEVGVNKVYNLEVDVANLMGQEVRVVGPAKSNNLLSTVSGGAVRRQYHSEDLGLALKPNSLLDSVNGGLKGGVKCLAPSVKNSGKKPINSLSSAGDVLCCSSLNSADIRNCNKNFLKKYEHEVASKVWQGALELGVEGEEAEGTYVERIITNETLEEEARLEREHRNRCHP